MTNRWKVIWVDLDSKKRLKKFDTAGEAVAYAKELKAQELEADVVSATHAYPIPVRTKDGKRHPKADRPSTYHLWCPYCIQWRVFSVSAVRFDGIRSPEARRCPVCTISTEDYYVRKYNGLLGKADEKMIYKGIVTLRNI